MGGYFTWMTIYAVNQTMIQRYLTVKDLRWLTSKVVKMNRFKRLVRTAKICIKDIYKIDQLRKLVPTLFRTAKISIWLSGVAITVILSIVAYAGLIIYTRYLSLLYIFIRIR